MTIIIINPLIGKFDLSGATNVDRLSLFAKCRQGEGVLFLIPMIDELENHYFDIDTENSTFPPLISVIESCRATACGPPQSTKFPATPRTGKFENLKIQINHQRHWDGAKQHELGDIYVLRMAQTTLNAAMHLREDAYSYF